MVSRETQHHTTLKFYKLDIKKPQLCGFCHIILFTSVKNPIYGKGLDGYLQAIDLILNRRAGHK